MTLLWGVVSVAFEHTYTAFLSGVAQSAQTAEQCIYVLAWPELYQRGNVTTWSFKF